MNFFVGFVILYYTLLNFSGFSQTPVLTRGPYLNIGTASSMVIHWRTDSTLNPVNSRVWYGTVLDTAQMTILDEPTATNDHVIQLSNLTESTKYFYAIGTSDHLLLGPDSNLYFKNWVSTEDIPQIYEITIPENLGVLGRSSVEECSLLRTEK